MPKIATIGFFDGVHRGHRFLFAQLHEHAKHYQLTPAIYTFDCHPKELLTGKAPAMLTTHDERKMLLQPFGEVHFLDFAQVQHLTAEQFMRYLQEEEQVEVLLMGYDHRFGSDQLKGFSEYEKVARGVGLRVERAHECLVDSLPVSSTRIRKLLHEGQIKQVNRLLGYHYSLIGIVEHGNGIGAQIGFPTANICLQSDKLLPIAGVYAACAVLEGDSNTSPATYAAVVNIGNNPTVGNNHLTIEAHLINYQGDLYGKTITVALREYIRAERKFDSLQKLQEQIRKDIQSL